MGTSVFQCATKAAAVDLSTHARKAYAAEWTLFGGPLTPRVQNGCAAAIINPLEHADHPGIFDATEEQRMVDDRLMLLSARSDALASRRQERCSWESAHLGSRAPLSVRGTNSRLRAQWECG